VSPAPTIQRVVETALYVDDMDRAVAFYRDVLGLRPLTSGERLCAMDAGGATVLLLFARGGTRDGLRWDGGYIPPHDGAGPLHMAFGIDAGELDAWLARLGAHGVAVESHNRWERGGSSIYFRDPDGHSLELVTPGTWATY